MKLKKMWLISILIITTAMIISGGITRLTQSGLSIVEWKLIIGTFPPLTDAAWQKVFIRYQHFPEYQLVNKGMTLSEFKFIFFWEYLHRLIGRVIGLVCILPYLYMVVKGKLDSTLKKRGGIIIALVIGQGLLGWYMVKSGLVHIPTVSHFRLAAHLGVAFFFICYVLWTYLDLIKLPKVSKPRPKLFKLTAVFIGFLSVQILYGAFTAGLKAGHFFNTFPLMNGKVMPDLVYSMSPIWKNLVSNPFAIQFMHRWLGITVLIIGLYVAYDYLKTPLSNLQQKTVYTVVGLLSLQVILGISALLLSVPIVLGILHQLVALLLLSSSIILIYQFPKQLKPQKDHLFLKTYR